MKYYDAREIVKDGGYSGKYRYTCEHDGSIYAVGYCANNCEGHNTKDEACEHYRQYSLDNAVYGVATGDIQRKCKICGDWTNLMVRVGSYSLYDLCKLHQDRDSLDKVVESYGYICSS
jgi:hypothetical protein